MRNSSFLTVSNLNPYHLPLHFSLGFLQHVFSKSFFDLFELACHHIGYRSFDDLRYNGLSVVTTGRERVKIALWPEKITEQQIPSLTYSLEVDVNIDNHDRTPTISWPRLPGTKISGSAPNAQPIIALLTYSESCICADKYSPWTTRLLALLRRIKISRGTKERK